MGVLTTVLELLGLCLVVAGVVGLAFWFWPAAVIVAGVGLLFVSHQISRRGTV